MTDDLSRWCVLIPCSRAESWAVPQNCLAEILTLHTSAESPPREISWRGRQVPVLDLGGDDGTDWREAQRGTGLIAIFLGLEGEGCDYWGVAVRGAGLSVTRVAPEDIQDVPDAVVQHATAAFSLRGGLYQVPELDTLQKHLAVGREDA